MGISMLPILIHSDAVPLEARDALKSASYGSPSHRNAQLESAARILHQQTGLDCPDARELVGLPRTGGCG
jgi:hypothetical protein